MNTVIEFKRAALLLIDLQEEYRAQREFAVMGYDQIVANARSLLLAARQHGVPVVHVQFWVEAAERGDYPLLDENVNTTTRSGVAGSRDADLCVEVAALPGELVIKKRWPSAFMQTELDAQLRQTRVQHLIVAGVWTDSCVRGSVLDATFKGYRVWLVKDACGSATQAMHRAATLDIANRLYGGGVFTTAQALNAMCGERYRVWRCSRPIEFRYDLDTLDELYEKI